MKYENEGNAKLGGLVKELGLQIVTSKSPFKRDKTMKQNGAKQRTSHCPILIPQTATFCVAMDNPKESSFAAQN